MNVSVSYNISRRSHINLNATYPAYAHRKGNSVPVFSFPEARHPFIQSERKQSQAGVKWLLRNRAVEFDSLQVTVVRFWCEKDAEIAHMHVRVRYFEEAGGGRPSVAADRRGLVDGDRRFHRI